MKSKNAQLDLILNMANSTLREAQKANNKDGPDFSAVVKMIDNMLDVLNKEQADDQKKKDWCVDELQKADAAEKKEQEHPEYSDTLSMTETAIQLVGKAKNRLNKFYNPKAYKPPAEKDEFDQEAFVQIHRHTHQKVAPPELESPPELKQSNRGGVIGMMDEITHELEMDMQQ